MKTDVLVHAKTLVVLVVKVNAKEVVAAMDVQTVVKTVVLIPVLGLAQPTVLVVVQPLVRVLVQQDVQLLVQVIALLGVPQVAHHVQEHVPLVVLLDAHLVLGVVPLDVQLHAREGVQVLVQ